MPLKPNETHDRDDSSSYMPAIRYAAIQDTDNGGANWMHFVIMDIATSDYKLYVNNSPFWVNGTSGAGNISSFSLTAVNSPNFPNGITLSTPDPKTNPIVSLVLCFPSLASSGLTENPAAGSISSVTFNSESISNSITQKAPVKGGSIVKPAKANPVRRGITDANTFGTPYPFIIQSTTDNSQSVCVGTAAPTGDKTPIIYNPMMTGGIGSDSSSLELNVSEYQGYNYGVCIFFLQPIGSINGGTITFPDKSTSDIPSSQSDAWPVFEI